MGIISADMALAIPLAAASIMLVALGIGSMQSTLVAYAGNSYSQIRHYSISQQMISLLSGRNMCKSAYASELANLSAFYNVSAYTTGLSNYTICAKDFCRIVEVAGMERIMVIR